VEATYLWKQREYGSDENRASTRQVHKHKKGKKYT